MPVKLDDVGRHSTGLMSYQVNVHKKLPKWLGFPTADCAFSTGSFPARSFVSVEDDYF
jgi:hypothetical protein